ncbi:MAG: nucleolar RNA-binding Nop10p family protein [Candidatus Rehaiarchaeum fermentans]|nr:RNA-protein complex protein Nop10 [Candidatus Rehaiarchaeum fermentans]MCW1292854.1 RNA-protein complex protein Nop10 [Candidatus Rehaiarchaeum fermentans]MCW1293373.1 RNA-protein complex protein Nop10 [Candidatus Rehaiarchaeum fermentans]MCW1297567.1 RNA-protein complex protein Nop10 [Candidatus Rehaiarchaeum fermentans]MCW1302026.1 RNA-protein complex protein Nop10 [Candidatus Rehaiarchaeum fermentans]
MRRIKYCFDCKLYTLEDKCPKCGKETIVNSPLRYSTNEILVKYRREINEKRLKEKGLL